MAALNFLREKHNLHISMARTKVTARSSSMNVTAHTLSQINDDDPDTTPPVKKRPCLSSCSDCDDIFSPGSSSDESNEGGASPPLIPVVLRAEDISRQIRIRRNKMRTVAEDALLMNARLDKMLQRMREVAHELVRLSNEIDSASAVISAKI